MHTLDRVALDRLGLLTRPEGASAPGPAVATAALAELSHVGVAVTNPSALSDELASLVPAVVSHLARRRGQTRTHAPLFRGFPDQLPAFDDAGLRFLLGASRLVRTYDPGAGISDDDLRSAMDFSEIGWWPASSVPQDLARTELERAIQQILPRDSRVEWQEVRIVSAQERDTRLREWMQHAFSAATSLREDVTADLRELVGALGVDHLDATQVRFRETRVLLAELLWRDDPARVRELSPTPDDLLRLLARLTDSDVSLTERIRFPRLRRPQRRALVAALEASPRLGEVFRRRGLWLAIDRGLHLGEHDAPRTQEVFARLRATRHDTSSTMSRFERTLATEPARAYTLLADEAPGVLARTLRRLLAHAESTGSADALLDVLSAASGRVPLRLLLAARSQVADNGRTYPRVAFGKTGKPMPVTHSPGHLAVSEGLCAATLAALDAAVTTHLRTLPSWEGERVHIHPALEHVLVPEALRSTSQGLVQVERGSRLPLGEARVVRLFTHWREAPESESSDLDLSCVALDENFEVVEFVSWTRLRGGSMVHSGDITSAPHGAEEFIDVELDAARELMRTSGWRYLAPAVFRYSGPTFSSLTEASAGWMLREDCSSEDRTFDPATVANAFALTGSQRTALPLLLDLQTDEVCYVDVYLKGSPAARVERDGTGIASLVRAVAARRDTRLSVAELVRTHLAARGGALVSDPSDATITFGLDASCTYDVLRPERLLAEML